jgi:hypothetical protein
MNSDYNFLPLEEAVSPKRGGYFHHVINGWWAVHPEWGLVFWKKGQRPGLGAPQYNSDERIVRSVGLRDIPWPEVEIRQIPSVWVPIDISDYR